MIQTQVSPNNKFGVTDESPTNVYSNFTIFTINGSLVRTVTDWNVMSPV